MIKIKVEPYDSDHKSKLESGIHGDQFKKLFANGLTTTESALLIESMFTLQNHSRDGYRSRQELANQAPKRADMFRENIIVSGNSFHSATTTSTNEDKLIRENVGVACAILSMNEVLGNTEADWEKIPESNKFKSLDFKHVSSDGKTLIALEAKGTLAQDPTLKSSGSTSTMKADILKKKSANGAGVDFQYGAITAFGPNADTSPIVYFVDPPADGATSDPRLRKIVSRLSYYARHLELVSDFHMLIALRDRINVLMHIESYEELESLPLVNIHREKFSRPASYNRWSVFRHGNITWRAFGHPANPTFTNRPILAIGVADNLFETVVDQNYSRISSWRWQFRSEGEGRVRIGGFKEYQEAHARLVYGVNRAGIAQGWLSPVNG